MAIDNHNSIKRTSLFRFYEELNEFLSQKQRKTSFRYSYIGTPSVKDTIEAIGVPHVEVDLILVDGKSVDFNYLLEGGELISVYPVFESLDLSDITHLREEPLRETKFVVDVNLGKLAHKLRLLGFDTLYKNDFADDEIVEISLKERRIILTRDKGILKYGDVTHGYWVRSDDLKEQIVEVVSRIQLQNSFKPFTRCSVCNGKLHETDKSSLGDQLQDDVLRDYDLFLLCDDCGKVYWQGSHYDRINEWIKNL